MNNALKKANETTGRMGVFGAISTISTYFLNLWLPKLPVEVKGAFLVLLMAGLVYADKYIHERKDWKANGITPF